MQSSGETHRRRKRDGGGFDLLASLRHRAEHLALRPWLDVPTLNEEFQSPIGTRVPVEAGSRENTILEQGQHPAAAQNSASIDEVRQGCYVQPTKALVIEPSSLHVSFTERAEGVPHAAPVDQARPMQREAAQTLSGPIREEEPALDSAPNPAMIIASTRHNGSLQQPLHMRADRQHTVLQEEPEHLIGVEPAPGFDLEPGSPGMRPAQPLILPLEEEEAGIMDHPRQIASASERSLIQNSTTESEEMTSFVITGPLKKTDSAAEQRNRPNQAHKEVSKVENSKSTKRASRAPTSPARKPRRRKRAAVEEAEPAALPRTRPLTTVTAFKTTQNKKARQAAKANQIRSIVSPPVFDCRAKTNAEQDSRNQHAEAKAPSGEQRDPTLGHMPDSNLKTPVKKFPVLTLDKAFTPVKKPHKAHPSVRNTDPTELESRPRGKPANTKALQPSAAAEANLGLAAVPELPEQLRPSRRSTHTRWTASSSKKKVPAKRRKAKKRKEVSTTEEDQDSWNTERGVTDSDSSYRITPQRHVPQQQKPAEKKPRFVLPAVWRPSPDFAAEKHARSPSPLSGLNEDSDPDISSMSSTEGVHQQSKHGMSEGGIKQQHRPLPLARRFKSASSFPPPQKLHRPSCEPQIRHSRVASVRRGSNTEGSTSLDGAASVRSEPGSPGRRHLRGRGRLRNGRKLSRRRSRLSLSLKPVPTRQGGRARIHKLTPEEEAQYQAVGSSRALPLAQKDESERLDWEDRPLLLSKLYQATSRFLERQKSKSATLGQVNLQNFHAAWRQSQMQVHRFVVRASNIAGQGVFTTESLSAGELLMEYTGQVIRRPIADMRERQAPSGIYFFTLEEDFVLDGTKSGGIARFVNHCCCPNSMSKVLTIEGQKRVFVFAKRHIFRGEELTYDYFLSPPDSSNVNGRNGLIPCNCRAEGCRLFL